MKKINLLLLIAFSVIFLVSCGKKVADEQQIQIDLEGFTQESILSDDEKIVEIIIDKRQTQKDEKSDIVWCTVRTEDKRCKYEKSFVLTYSLYDEGGWILDEVLINDKSVWVITPLIGVNDDDISASLIGIDVTVNGEIWHVTKDNMKSISIDSHETDLELQKDAVTATLTIDDLVEEASGQLIINYNFNHGSWIMDSISGREDFSAHIKPGVELNITEEMLLDTVNGQSFEYNPKEPKIYRTQKITINKDEVSDFIIEKQETSLKGTSVQYFCSCTLTKPYAAFMLTFEIPYHYSGEWNIQDISTTAECTFVDIVGNWTGTNAYSRNCELNITEMDEDGNISGTYSDMGKSSNRAYSYYVAGKINMDTLEITLKAGDIIGKEPYALFKPYDITARINVDDSSISGNADLQFWVTQ